MFLALILESIWNKGFLFVPTLEMLSNTKRKNLGVLQLVHRV
jgi:hypothetical protein